MLRRMMAVAALALSLGAAACTAEVQDEGEAPDVDVSGGEMPRVDIDPANVEVSTDTQTVVTPDVNVTPAGGDEK
ncbi:MAG TPA: hypothetical protein VHG08_20420 [Longimicrobium sp.]|nr:hypothetical protein [Longimicrobium sp.]